MERITTRRLTLSPMSDEDLCAHAAQCRASDPDLSAAYAEMLSECRAHPESRLWLTAWAFRLADGTEVGDANFKGFNSGRAEIGYGVMPQFEGRGYATEGAAALCRWAFANGAVLIDAEAAPDNVASLRVLEKLGFRPTGETGAEGPRFALRSDAF